MRGVESEVAVMSPQLLNTVSCLGSNVQDFLQSYRGGFEFFSITELAEGLQDLLSKDIITFPEEDDERRLLVWVD